MSAIEEAKKVPPEVRAEIEAHALAKLLDIVEEATLESDNGVYAWLDPADDAPHLVRTEALARVFSRIAERFVADRTKFSALDRARAEAYEERQTNAPLRARAEVLEKNLRKMIHLIERHLRKELESGHYHPLNNPDGWSWRHDFDEALKALLPDGV